MSKTSFRSLKSSNAFAGVYRGTRLFSDKQGVNTEWNFNGPKTFCVCKNFSSNLAIRSYLMFFFTYLASCGTVEVYKDPGKPVFFSNTIGTLRNEHVDSLNVVTFNIAEAEKMQLAISELQRFAKTKNIDIYLLQEMDEKGVEAIAKAFGLNYLYFPIVYNKLIKKNIGNAILTTGTIDRAEKLILPHAKWVNNRFRHVTIGEVTINQNRILVYSVHTETIMMSRKNRMDQVDTIVNHATMQLRNYKYLLLGGDFNTLYPEDATRVVNKFVNKGFSCATTPAGSTARALFGLIKPRLDYLFTTGLEVIDAGKIKESKSSDHYPVFATFRFQR